MKRIIISLVLALGGLVGLAESAPQKTPAQEPELRSELLRRTKSDQEAREEWIAWMKDHGSNGHLTNASLSKDEQAEFEKGSARMKSVDEENTKWLHGVIEMHGWPTYSLVGKDGADAAWLLVQHADADPKFQRRCLDLMTSLAKTEISQSNLAYLTDRVLLAEGKKQMYGTQFTSVDGKWEPRPIEDEANVDKRRADVGLQTLAEYKKVIERQYGGDDKK